MTKETALQVFERTNLRRYRAQVLTHQILRLVEPLIDYEDRSKLFRSLQKLFEEEGVEVLTDFEREKIGLPPRGPDGWTFEEIMALDQKRMELLTRPLPPMVIPAFSLAGTPPDEA